MKMLCLVSFAGVLTCLSQLAAAADPITAAKPVTKEQLADLVKALEASGKGWIDNDKEDPSTRGTLSQVHYDMAVADDLIAALKVNRKDPVSLYVVNRLLAPLVPAEGQPWGPKDVVKKLLPTVRTLESSLGRYQDMPHYNTDSLKQFYIPSTFPPNLQPAQVLSTLAAINRLRDEKLARERPISLHDLEASALQGKTWRFIAFAGDKSDDDYMLKAMVDKEQKGESGWQSILNAINKDGPSFEPERAKKYFGALVRLGIPLKWSAKNFADLANMPASPGDNSVATAVPLKPGIDILRTAKVLAPKIKAPDFKIPTTEVPAGQVSEFDVHYTNAQALEAARAAKDPAKLHQFQSLVDADINADKAELNKLEEFLKSK